MLYESLGNNTCERAVNRQTGDRARTCKGVGVTDSVTRSVSTGRSILTEIDENDAQNLQNP